MDCTFQTPNEINNADTHLISVRSGTRTHIAVPCLLNYPAVQSSLRLSQSKQVSPKTIILVVFSCHMESGEVVEEPPVTSSEVGPVSRLPAPDILIVLRHFRWDVSSHPRDGSVWNLRISITNEVSRFNYKIIVCWKKFVVKQDHNYNILVIQPYFTLFSLPPLPLPI